MKLRLTRPLPQPELGRVIPAGVVIDAPPALSDRLLREGRGKPLPAEQGPSERVAPGSNAKNARKRVKRNG